MKHFSNLNKFFDFSAGQLRVLFLLAISAACMSVYLVIRTHGRPAGSPNPLAITVSSVERKLTGTFVVDLNTSPADSLELLPGVGRVLADRIVEYRQSKPFVREIDVTEVKGIGPKLFESIRPYLKVSR